MAEIKLKANHATLVLETSDEGEIEKGKVVLGGCCVSECDPVWQCVNCKTKICKAPQVDAAPSVHDLFKNWRESNLLAVAKKGLFLQTGVDNQQW